jgi:hypothetical protein
VRARLLHPLLQLVDLRDDGVTLLNEGAARGSGGGGGGVRDVFGRKGEVCLHACDAISNLGDVLLQRKAVRLLQRRT